MTSFFFFNVQTNLKSKQGETKKKYKYKQEKNSSASLNSTNEKASTVRAENGINPLLDQVMIFKFNMYNKNVCVYEKCV